MQTGHAAAINDGTVIIDWTIDDAKNPAECRQSSAATIEITVYTLGGRSAGTYEQDCEAFATSIDLAPGDYTASALLLDAGGNERTTTLDISPFTIYGADQLTVPIDFPSDSFL